MNHAPLNGLVLAGGRSTRMRRDKAALVYDGRPQLVAAYELVAPLVERAFISVRADQAEEPLRAALPQIVDAVDCEGPIAGILTALEAYPEHAWLVVACDLPRLNAATLERLIANRDPGAVATAYRSSVDDLPEPLCAIWEPAGRAGLGMFAASGRHCPRKFLLANAARLVELADRRALDNVNTPDEYVAVARTAAVSP